MTSYDQIERHTKVLKKQDQVVAHELGEAKNRYVVVLNGQENELDVSSFDVLKMTMVLSNEGAQQDEGQRTEDSRTCLSDCLP